MRGPIDENMIAELRSILSDEGLGELLALYLEEAPRSLAVLERALAAQDLAAFRTAAHRLKGAAAGVGAREVADAAKALELGAQAGGLPADLDELRAALDRADAALRRIAPA